MAAARGERRWTAVELADRVGVSLNTLRNVERGVPTVAVGVMFELATLLGIELFGAEGTQLPDLVSRHRDRLVLLPARVRAPHGPVDDDF